MPESRPEFFIVREDKSITPLIALDELPPDISIRGVPRTMTLTEAKGMKHMGDVPSRGICYTVDYLRDPVGTTSHSTNDSFAITPYNGGSKGKNRFSEKKGFGSPSKPAKVYCSYWIRRGECDFEQQGCRFKHVMPRDLETLESIGLSDIPQWYREQENLPSLRPGPPTSAGLPKGSWRKASTPPKAIAQHNEEIQDNGNTLGGNTDKPGEKPGDKALDHPDNARPSPERIGRASGFENTGGCPYIQDMLRVSPASSPSMSHTVDSWSPRSSFGEHMWSPTAQRAKRHHTTVLASSSAGGEQASGKFDSDTEPEYRSITELLPFSMPEDRSGNIITERLTLEMPTAHWCWGPYF